MMSFQTIFENQQSMTVNTRRTVGQQVSRSGQVRVAQYLTSVPWVFTVTPHNYLSYATSRQIIQTIDNLDRQLPETITFSSANLAWFTDYQGELTTAQVNALTLASVPPANSQTISVGNLPSIASTKIVFKAGDFLQIGNYTYKVTQDVLRGVNTTVSVSLHRPVIGTPTVGTLAGVGNACEFTVLAERCPTYTLTPAPGGAFVNWDEAFVFREDITG
jgi:hypothetical protein